MNHGKTRRLKEPEPDGLRAGSFGKFKDSLDFIHVIIGIEILTCIVIFKPGLIEANINGQGVIHEKGGQDYEKVFEFHFFYPVEFVLKNFFYYKAR